MLRKALASLLILLLAAPLNAGAAAWMAMSMNESDQHVMPTDPAHTVHVQGTESSVRQPVDTAHPPEHDKADCEEHCLSCNNHCSSTAIVSSSRDSFDPEHRLIEFLPRAVLNRIDLLFRPPISV